MSGGKAPNSQDFRVLREMAEVLAGKRGDKSKAAVTRGEAQDLREFIAALRKGTADVQTELNGMVESIEETRASLEALTGDIDTTQEGLSAAQELLVDLQAALAEADTAITTLSGNASAALNTLENIADAADAITITGLDSTVLTAPPTAADFNDLREDVITQRAVLIALRNALR